MLRKFRQTLDISDCHNLALWAAIVVGFFSFLRASVPRDARDFEGVLFLRRSDIKFTDEGAVLKVRHSKTNQFGDRKVRIPIPRITGDILCPMLALQSLFKAVRVIPSLPAFSYAPFRWIHYSELLNGVKRVAIVSDVDPL
jgi:hypothetical protein